jgi:hypothetical protein
MVSITLTEAQPAAGQPYDPSADAWDDYYPDEGGRASGSEAKTGWDYLREAAPVVGVIAVLGVLSVSFDIAKDRWKVAARKRREPGPGPLT